MVEGVSVAAMAFYLMGLLDYLLNALNIFDFQLNKVLIKGFAVPIVLLLTWLFVRLAIRYVKKST